MDITEPDIFEHLRIKDNKQLVGLILTTCNDLELTKIMFPSLQRSMGTGYPFMLIAIDSGSTDGTLQYLWDRRVPVFGPHLPKNKFPYQTEHLCQALNAGLKMYLGHNPNMDAFEETDSPGTKMYLGHDSGMSVFEKKDAQGYIGWVHADMKFPEEGWLEKLVQICDDDPTIGKLGPDDWNAPKLPEAERLRPGNQCPWIMPVHALLKLWEKDGMLFDENYWFTQNFDDWDLNRRLINYGYKVLIVNDVRMKHEGMGTRKNHQDPKYQEAARHNQLYYMRKWGDRKCPV